MTLGDPSAPKPTVAARAVSRAVPKKAAKSTKSVGAREPRVTASKAGAAKRGASASAMSSTADDILDRLAKLGEAPPPRDTTVEASPLPTIVEADPTFPPLSIPAAAVAAADVLDRDATGSSSRPPAADVDVDAADPAATTSTADTDRSEGLSLPTVSGRTAPKLELVSAPISSAPVADLRTPDTSAPESSVSPDLPTALVPSPGDAGDTSVAVEPQALVPPLVPAVEALMPAPDHTQLAPVVPIEAPAVGQPGVDETTGVVLPKRPLRAPMVFRRAKPRVRRVTRVVRHVDTWSVFKVALVFNVILYLVCLTAGVLLWNVAHATGTVDNVEKFFEQFGWESFEFKGGEIYHNAWIGGLFVAVGLTGFAVLLATLFNLITDLVGGIRVSVLEEEVVATPRSSTTVSTVSNGANVPAPPDATGGAARP